MSDANTKTNQALKTESTYVFEISIAVREFAKCMN